MMSYARRVALVLALFAIVCASRSIAYADASSTVSALVARTLVKTPIEADLRELTDEIGGRPTGSKAMGRAVTWGLAKFSGAGLENVHAESYTAPVLWVPGEESATVVRPRNPWDAPVAAQLRVAAMPFAGGTPAGGLEADVADVGLGDVGGFKAVTSLRGRWALVHTNPIASIPDLFNEYVIAPGIFDRARRAGATGVLWIADRPSLLLYRHQITFNDTIFPLPGAVVEREGGLRLARLIESGQTVRVRVILRPTVQRNAIAQNVVAEIRGSEKPDEVVILGAHLDSWELGRGAKDDGCNAAMVVDAARQMMSLARDGIRPRRTVRFMLYSGEEAGLLGSWGDVRKLRAHLDSIKGVIAVDEGGGRTTGVSLQGRPDLESTIDAALAPISGLGPFVQTADAFMGTDNFDYMIEGIPTVLPNQDLTPYYLDYHANSDTYDKVDVRELKLNTAINAVLAWSLADSQAPLPPRWNHAQVKAMLLSTGVADQMKAFGVWADFESGKRGRAP
jgi:carboxypeptidase Q